MAIKLQDLIAKSLDLPTVDRDSRVINDVVRDFDYEASLVASRQSRSLAVNLALAICLLVGMMISRQFDIASILFIMAIAALSIMRARKSSSKSLKGGTYSLKRWYTTFAALTFGLGMTWGSLTAYKLVTYGAEGKIGFFLILLMAGMSAGALTAMTPWKKLSFVYVSLMLGIPMATLIALDPVGNFAFAGAVLTFYSFLILQGKQMAEIFVALRDREVRFETINRFGMEGALIHRNGKILEVNGAFLQIFNMERADVLKQPLFDFIRPDFHAQGREKLKEANNFWEVICVRPDGTEIQVETWANVVDFGGAPARVVYVRDISSRKKIEDALRDSERNLKEFMTSAFDSLSDILLVVAKDGKFESVNQKWRDFTGLDLESTNANSFAAIVAPEDRDGFLKFIRSRQISEQEFSAQLLRKSDNTYRSHLGRSSPVKDRNGVITKWFILWTDTHDQIQGIKRNHELEVTAKSAREASQIKSAFLANMSHEIRTPLNAIIGLSDLLLELPSSPIQNSYQSTLKTSAETLFSIVNDILDLSKIESGNVVAEELDFTLAPLIEFQVELMAQRARDKSLSLSSYIDPAIPLNLRGDSTRVAQVVLNLLSNAVKFTKSGGVAVRAQLLYENDNEAFVRLEVEDSGIGISSEEQKKLFQPFSQVDVSHTRMYGGTGLGLSICLGLIQVMNGRVFVHSEAGEGSLFVVDLPFRLDRKKTAELRAALAEPQMAFNAADKKRVLLMDSEPFAYGAKHAYLERWNRMPVPISLAGLLDNGRKSLDEADLLILDTSLAPAEFASAVKWIKEIPDQLQSKILLVGEESVRQELAKLNLNEQVRFLAKPIKQNEFKDLVEGARTAVSRIARASEINPKFKASPVAVKDVSVGSAQLASDSTPNSMPDLTSNFTTNTVSKSETDVLGGGLVNLATLAPATNASSASVEKVMSTKQILVVEDNTTNQMLIKALLKKIGYDPHVVANGVEAIDALKARSFDLILMDCQMPEMDGFEATLRIRASEIEEKKLDKIRIIALTANVRVEDRARCFAVGMDDFLSKPVRREALVEKLDQWLAA